MLIEAKKIKTSRIETAYLAAGSDILPKLMLIHGNTTSSAVYSELMEKLADKFCMVAPDMRCFGESEAVPVDATRGIRDFSDDIDAFAEAIGWEKFSIMGWSLGGGVCMQYAIDHAEKLEKIIMQNPLSPYGFGGTYDVDGKMLEPRGIASGGGCANAELVKALVEGGRDFIAATIDGVFVAPPFQIEASLKEKYIDSVLTTRVGEGMYPGNTNFAESWPGVIAGDSGICNTMAPNYCDLSPLADIKIKPDILWIRGAADVMVSDTSVCDFGFLGQIGAVPGYPGVDVFPAQPMVSQTRYVLDKYAENGGKYTEVVIAGGHGCMLDNETEYIEEVLKFM